MKRYIIQTYLWLCCVVVSSLFSFASAAPGGGVGVLSEGGSLTLYNSIVWDNSSSTQVVSGSNNLINIDPLFASATEFLPLADSPAKGKGINSVWDALTGIAKCDIAGIFHATPINIGAFENNAFYTITFTTDVAVYLDNQVITSGVSFPAGTELKVVATVKPGNKLEALTANNTPIRNGEPFILTGDTKFEASFLPARKDVYATFKDGTGKLNVFNTIIYDNIDLFGNYSPDASNVTANPLFSARTTYTLQAKSQALGLGDGSKLTGVASDIAGTTINTAASVDAGAYQTIQYIIDWTVANGTLEVFKYAQNADDQWEEFPLQPGDVVSAGTIIVRAKADNGYILSELKENGLWINPEDEGKDPLKKPILTEGRFSVTAHTTITASFIQATGANVKVAAEMDGGIFKNNIVYDNNGIASNLTESDPLNPVNNVLDIDPKFTNRNNYALQNTSPGLNKGDNSVISGVTNDITGISRIQGTKVDFGAYEMNMPGFTVTYTSKIQSKNDVVAIVELFDGNNLVESGTQLLAGTLLKVKVTILDDHFEQLGRIKLNDGVLERFIPDDEFTLDANLAVTVQVRAKIYHLTYNATNAALTVNNLASGAEISYDSYLTVQVYPSPYHELEFVSVNGQHIEGAEKAGGYVVHVTGDVTIVASATPEYLLDENGDPVKDNPSGVNDPSNWLSPEVKGLITWDIQNATLTAIAGGNPVALGDMLEPGTEVQITVAPTNPDYGFLVYQLNGTDLDLSKTTFSVTIPAADLSGKVPTTFIAVHYGENGRKPNDPTPPPAPKPVYVTLTIPDNLPEGITINPAPGEYQVQEGSSKLITLSVDEAYDEKYVFLKMDEEYILMKAPGESLDFSYLLLNINKALTIEVIVSDTDNPVSNTQVTSLKVWGGNGLLYVKTATDTPVSIYAVSGRLIAQRRVNGQEAFPVPAGVYIVRMPTVTVKVFVNY